jgi:hypothetical protein
MALADRVAQVFYVFDPETGKHIVFSTKQKSCCSLEHGR